MEMIQEIERVYEAIENAREMVMNAIELDDEKSEVFMKATVV